MTPREPPYSARGLHFPAPVVALDLGAYQALVAERDRLQLELAEAKERIGRLGYDFVGRTARLHVVQDPGRPAMIAGICVPEIRIRAEDAVTAMAYRINREEAMMRQEAAITAAMRHAAETWVKTSHDLAARERAR